VPTEEGQKRTEDWFTSARWHTTSTVTTLGKPNETLIRGLETTSVDGGRDERVPPESEDDRGHEGRDTQTGPGRYRADRPGGERAGTEKKQREEAQGNTHRAPKTRARSRESSQQSTKGNYPRIRKIDEGRPHQRRKAWRWEPDCRPQRGRVSKGHQRQDKRKQTEPTTNAECSLYGRQEARQPDRKQSAKRHRRDDRRQSSAHSDNIARRYGTGGASSAEEQGVETAGTA